MRKSILILVALALASSMAYAQEATVKKAKSKASSDDSANVSLARTLIDQALKDETTKNTAFAWYVNGLVYSKVYDLEDNKRLEIPPRTPNQNVQSEAAYNAYKAWLVADSLDVVESKTDPKRKGKLKYRNEMAEKIISLMPYIDNYGNVLFNKQKFAEAKDVYIGFIKIPDLEMFKGNSKLNPNDSIFYFAKSNLKLDMKRLCFQYLNNNDSTSFLKTLEEGLALYPTDDYFLRNKIQYSLNKGDKNGALENINKTLALNPNNVTLYYVRGYIYALQPDKRKEAMADFQEAINKKPDYAEAYAGYGNVLYFEGEDFYKKSIDLLSNPKASDDAKKKAEDIYRQAIPYYEKAIALKDTDDGMLLRLQGIYRKLKMYDKEKEIKTLRENNK